MRFSLSRLIKVSPVVWAFSAAVAVQMFAPEIWWHPDCHLAEPFHQTAAAGLPFPYAQRAVSTSDIFYMPHVLLANLIIVAGLALPVAGFLVRRSARARLPQGIQAVASVVALSSLLLIFIPATLIVLRPTESIASSDESYFDYRPVFGGFKVRGGSRCVRPDASERAPREAPPNAGHRSLPVGSEGSGDQLHGVVIAVLVPLRLSVWRRCSTSAQSSPT